MNVDISRSGVVPDRGFEAICSCSILEQLLHFGAGHPDHSKLPVNPIF